MTVAVLALAAVVAAACAGSEPSQAAPAPAAQEAAGGNALPPVTVVDVVSGESLALSSLAPADRPILVWFWAPH